MGTKWTVVGLYEDTGQVFIDYAVADDAYAAMAEVSQGKPDSLCILGASPGDIDFFTPGDDNGVAAYASDLSDLTD